MLIEGGEVGTFITKLSKNLSSFRSPLQEF